MLLLSGFVLSVVFVLSSCSPGPKPVTKDDFVETTPTKKPETKAAAWPTDIKIHRDKDGKVVCPVMKDEVTSPDGKEFADYKGVRYYFCCGMCPKSFKDNPPLYAEK